MFTVSRRNLASLAFGGLASMASGASAAIPPINRPGKSLIKLAVAAYSFRRLLDFKTKSPPTMTMEQFAEWTAGLGLGAIEPTSYYFSETSNAAMAKYKLYCAKLIFVFGLFSIICPFELRNTTISSISWLNSVATFANRLP